MVDRKPQITAVVPVKNRAELLRHCLNSLEAAVHNYGNALIVVCDNGSTDESVSVAQSRGEVVSVVHSEAKCVGGVRNDGAATAPSAEVLAFVDCDCIVPSDFFDAIAEILESSGAAAVGCEVVSPSDGHWSERAWDGLHRPGGDGPRHYINSACFCIRSEWFKQVGGFDAQKVSSEDVDICRRLAAEGGTMWQSERLAVLHKGNPQSIAGLYRRIRWHGEGVWERGKGIQWSVSTIATFSHVVAVTTGLVAAAYLTYRGRWIGVMALMLSLLIVPSLFVFARAVQHRRTVPLLGGIALMSITFPARAHGLLRSIIRPRA